MLRERLSKKYPDKNFDDDEAFAGQVSDDYDDYDKRLADYQKNEQAIGDMFATDPRATSFLMEWKDGSDPVVALVRTFGKDIVDAADDPARQEEIAKANREYIERVNKSKELDNEYETNYKSRYKLSLMLKNKMVGVMSKLIMRFNNSFKLLMMQ